jgi:hypothetical protein
MSERDAIALVRLDPIDAATVLVERAGGSEPFMEALEPMLRTTLHSLTHGLLANLKPALAVTTNYDQGYEIALAAMGSHDIAVLPWTQPRDAWTSCVLKLHGDLTKGMVVLSRDDFVAMQAYRRPLSGVLQESLLAGHVLAVGTSMSDPTLVHAAEEVTALLRQVDRQSGVERGPCGTVILTTSDSGRAELLARTFTVAVADNEEGEGAAETVEAARRVDVLLDWLGMQCSADLSFMVDPIYASLLDDRDREIAVLIGQFADDMKGLAPVRGEESELGAAVNSFLKSIGILS